MEKNITEYNALIAALMIPAIYRSRKRASDVIINSGASSGKIIEGIRSIKIS
jgi:hypothetical protein